MKKFYLLTFTAIGLSLSCCKSSNDEFDPFDKDFSFHNNMKLTDYDTIWDTCGYWAFEKDNKKGLKVGYYFEGEEIIGKGFSLEIDRINTIECDSLFHERYTDEILTRALNKSPFEIEQVKNQLSEFGVKSIKIVSDFKMQYEMEIVTTDNKKFKAWLKGRCNMNGEIIRYLNFVNPKEELQD